MNKNSVLDNEPFKLRKAQILMLQLSDDDIKNSRLISQEQLDNDDGEFLDSLEIQINGNTL